MSLPATMSVVLRAACNHERYQQILGEAETHVRTALTSFYSSGKTSTQAAKDPETSMYKYIKSLFPMLKGEDIYTLVKTVNTEMITMNSLTEDEKKNLKQSLHKAKSQIHDAFVLDGSVRNTKFTRSMKILVSQRPETLGIRALEPYLVDTATARMLDPLKEQFPVLTYLQIYELVKSVVTEVASGLEAPTTMDSSSSSSQGGNNNGVSLNIDQTIDAVEMPAAVSLVSLTRGLLTMSVVTLGMDIGLLFLKPVKGGIFDDNKGIYYLTLGGIFASGVCEALTAKWLARTCQTDTRRFSFGRLVLGLSVVPFACALGLSTCAFIYR